VAAQTVQRSAFPDRYAKAQTAAQEWLRQISGPTSSGSSCGGDGLLPAATERLRPGAIPAGYRIPASATDAERRAVTFALAQLGKPYVFGASGPDSYDCSGLTMAAWTAAGIQLPHYTLAQYQAGVPVADPSLMAPGDLIFIPGDDGSQNPPNPQHVGMYIGDDYIIEAPQTGDFVKIVALARFNPIIGLRHIV
jgi:cell wall-associated NlpC family hydrolase